VPTTAAAAQTLLGAGFKDASNKLNATLNSLGADARRISNQIKFNNARADATNTGLGAIVDADLAKESAKLQSLQTKQQLGVQSLSIADQSPQVLLGLFR
jgi:flagellin